MSSESSEQNRRLLKEKPKYLEKEKKKVKLYNVQTLKKNFFLNIWLCLILSAAVLKPLSGVGKNEGFNGFLFFEIPIHHFDGQDGMQLSVVLLVEKFIA